jgi:hypothetical protein
VLADHSSTAASDHSVSPELCSPIIHRPWVSRDHAMARLVATCCRRHWPADRTTSVELRSATSFGLSHGLSTEIVVAAHKNSK